MSQGIFHVQFKSNLQDSGQGLVVIKNGSINGGDDHYLYRGTAPQQTGAFTGKLHVNKWKDGNRTVVNIDNFQLDVNGKIDFEAGQLDLVGTVTGQPQLQIQIIGRKVGDAF
ncbi:TPA: hypothetical protein RQ640_001269 [Pseudomonas aeruginosa]|uniref:GrlR family regulatory protein n=1 Tax=Pseudomonas aeruginosa TaxID=287 RepID=UPI000D693C92|nr:GrlR family regulatory protein [Pseudomonas aeruginosa]HDY5025884.1 hypothetical protein [Pseudomonas aeruginosa]